MGHDGEKLGVRPTPEALRMASDMDLDLVEVASKANPPVCRIMDYGKWKYEQSQRDKESRKKSTNVTVKEMKYRPKIGQGDFDTKTRKVEKFLGEGSKVKVTIMFRGREMQHPELGRRILDNVADTVIHLANIEFGPNLEGRNMVMVLGPDKKKLAVLKKAQDEAAAAAAAAEIEADLAEVDADSIPATNEATNEEE
ncbi:MAG: translation initiation factor IF-3 [Verrucomicrobiales bacterium]